MALTLSDMLTRVKRKVNTTALDTELQDALLERMNYLAAMDAFPFQEKYQYLSVASGNYRFSAPDDLGAIKELIIWTADHERPLEFLDLTVFDSRFPNPSEAGSDQPVYWTLKVAESEIWVNCPTDHTYEFRCYYLAIPGDVTDQTISQLTELAKLTVIGWAVADGWRMMQEHDRAAAFEQDGNQKFIALQRHYELVREESARFMSQKEHWKLYQGE